MLWDRPGSLQKSKDRSTASLPAKTVNLYLTGQDSVDFGIPVAGAYSATDGPVAVSTGKRRSLQEIQLIIDHTRTTAEQHAGEDTERAI
jgi:hypothetical protein